MSSRTGAHSISGVAPAAGWSLLLAQRGWQVVGVDVVPKAIDAAQQRADAAGIDVVFREGDVTNLRDAASVPSSRCCWTSSASTT